MEISSAAFRRDLEAVSVALSSIISRRKRTEAPDVFIVIWSRAFREARLDARLSFFFASLATVHDPLEEARVRGRESWAEASCRLSRDRGSRVRSNRRAGMKSGGAKLCMLHPEFVQCLTNEAVDSPWRDFEPCGDLAACHSFEMMHQICASAGFREIGEPNLEE